MSRLPDPDTGFCLAMILKDIPVLIAAFAWIILAGCDFPGEQQDNQQTYESRMKSAQDLKDKAEKLYLDAMSHEAATDQRNLLLKRAYNAGEKAMNIFNKLDEQFGQRVVPDGEVLAHKPVMEELSELMDHIVRAMSAID